MMYMENEEIAQLKKLLRKYIEVYIEPNDDITDQARKMYVQVATWIILNDVNKKH